MLDREGALCGLGAEAAATPSETPAPGKCWASTAHANSGSLQEWTVPGTDRSPPAQAGPGPGLPGQWGPQLRLCSPFATWPLLPLGPPAIYRWGGALLSATLCQATACLLPWPPGGSGGSA